MEESAQGIDKGRQWRRGWRLRWSPVEMREKDLCFKSKEKKALRNGCHVIYPGRSSNIRL